MKNLALFLFGLWVWLNTAAYAQKDEYEDICKMACDMTKQASFKEALDLFGVLIVRVNMKGSCENVNKNCSSRHKSKMID